MPPLDRLPDRLLGALLAAAEERGITAALVGHQGPLAVIELPDRGAAIAVLERGAVDREELRARLDRVLAGHQGGVLHLVLAGGTLADRPTLQAADREARDPNKIGVHHLDDTGTFERVAGRRLSLLAEAAQRVRTTAPLDPADVPALMERGQRAREEAGRFAAALARRPQRATRIIGGACIVFFLLQNHWQSTNPMAWFDMGANSVQRLGDEPWRLLSYAFLHAGWVHLVLNLMGLLGFGGFLEGLLGWRRYLLLYGLAALGGGLASAAVGQAPSIGASGAIWGLMTAGLGLMLWQPQLMPRLMVARIRPRLLGLLALNIGISVLPFISSIVPGAAAAVPRIDMWAHAGGGLVGLALVVAGVLTAGMTPAPAGDALASPGREPLAIRIGALAMGVALAAAMAIALTRGRPWEPRHDDREEDTVSWVSQRR